MKRLLINFIIPLGIILSSIILHPSSTYAGMDNNSTKSLLQGKWSLNYVVIGNDSLKQQTKKIYSFEDNRLFIVQFNAVLAMSKFKVRKNTITLKRNRKIVDQAIILKLTQEELVIQTIFKKGNLKRLYLQKV